MVGISDLRADPVNFRDREGGGDMSVSGDGTFNHVLYNYRVLFNNHFSQRCNCRCAQEAPGGGGHREAALRLELGSCPQPALGGALSLFLSFNFSFKSRHAFCNVSRWVFSGRLGCFILSG